MKEELKNLLNLKLITDLKKYIDGQISAVKTLFDSKLSDIELQKGDKGDDYVLTEQDKKDIASSITVPIVEKVVVEKVIEKRTEVIKEKPIITEITKEIIKEVPLADEKKIIANVLAKIPKPKDGKDADLQELKNLKKQLADLESRLTMAYQNPVRVVGGGGGKGVDILDEQSAISQNPVKKLNFSGAGVSVTYLGNDVATVTIAGSEAATIYTETPTGLINGSNTTYTTAHNITTVFSFAINSAFIHPDQYTISTNEITFTSPIPADLAGTNYTIIYA